VRVIREINDLVEQRHRGEKHMSLNANLSLRRSLVEILESGERVPITEGDWWVFDDMSDNFPHWWTGPENVQLIGRQGLYAYDIKRRWLGVEKIGTVRDSYTAAIILRFLRRLMADFGKPRRGIIFERSVWQSRAITGCRITSGGTLIDEEMERPGMSNPDKALLQEGIESLGLTLHYTYTPRGKEIEGAFNHLQRLKPMFAGRKGINLGRHAGEFEAGAKHLRRVRAASHTPESLGFLHIDASRDLDLELMNWINAQPYQQATGEDIEAPAYPALGELSDRDLAVFLPETRELQITNGKLTARVDGQPYDFVAPELFAALGSGYRLALKFDPAEPTLGGAIYNRDASSANRHGWQVGEFIGWAEFLPEVARFDWSQGGPDEAAALKRRFNKHIRTSYGAVGLQRRGTAAAAVSIAATVRDGRGQVAEVSGGASVPASRAPAAEPKLTTTPRRVARTGFEPLDPQTQSRRRNRFAEEAELARNEISST